MNELSTISQVSKLYGVSTRTLRYYEQIGLLESQRIEGYSYRVYDEENCLRLREIIVLRKLRIPLKQIELLLQNQNIAFIIGVFWENIQSMNEQITSLTLIRDILTRLVNELNLRTGTTVPLKMLTDETLQSMLDSIPLVQINLKEGSSMNELEKANEQLGKLSDRDVRIIYLPPCVVASYQYEGDDPEMHANQVIDAFVRDNDLVHKKPDLRHFGFNCPNPKDESGYHGYEIWVTVPETMEIPAPLVRKEFAGGIYAARMIPFGAFEEWDRLHHWVEENDTYEYKGNWDSNIMFGWMEEHLNYVNHVYLENTEPEGFQLDLLYPLKEKDIRK